MQTIKTLPPTSLPSTDDEKTAAVAVVDAIQQAEATVQVSVIWCGWYLSMILSCCKISQITFIHTHSGAWRPCIINWGTRVFARCGGCYPCRRSEWTGQIKPDTQ